jgi:ATPase subunit of ABC transporter with duplicated ATPase domains
MLTTQNLAIQFGAKPLFEHVTLKFVDGNRYGLIGANGCGKSTLMKILGRELEPSAGEVVLQAGLRMGKLNQNQFGYEEQRVIDVVMQGHAEMWAAMTERDRIYANPTPPTTTTCAPPSSRRSSPSTTATPPRRAPARS